MANQRQTAKICRILDLLNGSYVIQEGWEPNYVNTNIGKVSRVNLIGVIVGVEDALTFYLDDGSSKIMVRAFQGNMGHECKAGNMVMVIGRPRMYNNELFLVPEIVKQITDTGWVDYRKKQLINLSPPKKPVKKMAEEPHITQEDPDDILLNTMEKMDEGGGVEIEELLQKTNQKEDRIKRLLEEGIIFNNKPGYVKAL